MREILKNDKCKRRALRANERDILKSIILWFQVCSGGSKATADYLFCATRSGDIVKLYVDFLASDGSNNASVVATQIKKAPSKKGMNAGKFTGGKQTCTNKIFYESSPFYLCIKILLKIIKTINKNDLLIVSYTG